MLKIVGTEEHDIIDEKVIIDDKNKLTLFGVKFILVDLVLDMCMFYLISRIVKRIAKK